jgi:uncharacterized protein YlxW (UPF0749 family)
MTTLSATNNGTETNPIDAPAAPHADHAWVWQVTALSVVLGCLLALSVRTTTRYSDDDAGGDRLGVSAAFLKHYRDRNGMIQSRVVELNRQVELYMNQAGKDSEATQALMKEFEAIKAASGLAAASGPGLKITVADSSLDAPAHEDFQDYMVHDQDLNNLIAELKEAGCTQLGISGADESRLQRLTVTTTARCVGPVAAVNEEPLSAPYHILAIGDPKRLRAALEQPTSYLHRRQLDTRKMITIEELPVVELPEHAGPVVHRYAKPVETGRGQADATVEPEKLSAR